MKTLLLSPRMSGESIQLNNHAIDKKGWEVERVYRWSDIDKYKNTKKDVYLYSEWMFAEAFMEKTGIKFFSPPDDILLNINKKYTKRNIVKGKLREYDKLKGFFVKPVSGKMFNGGIYNDNELSELDKDIDVLFSEPIKINAEFRVYVSNKKQVFEKEFLTVNTGSPVTSKDHLLQFFSRGRSSKKRERQYLSEDKPYKVSEKGFENIYIDEFGSFINDVICSNDLFNLKGSYVLDIGYSKSNGLFVIELNPLWQSGFKISADDFLQLLTETKLNDK